MSVADNGGPSYISAHSADVILSDIRPIKLKIEALRSINVLLDEFLYSILNTACSLSTDKLRASLLSLLPTTLGKEALLEAEVELRAYWDRTGPAGVEVLEDDTKTFQLQWAFELLRLKCEAYSTLNETDEDSGAERRINDKILSGGGVPPTTALVAPAALYLTAILEAMCEHILSNVGRVASRDSSRTTATVNDLFVALCEDHAIYHFFKTMEVYEQIEELSKGPSSRRSKSFTRGDKYLGSSTHQDLSNSKDGPPISRLSSESGITTTAVPTPSSAQVSRSSFEKGRAMKMFMANRSSIDRDVDASQAGHRKSDSFLGEIARQTSGSLVQDSMSIEDEAMQKEFDDLMRSSATVKVSLTPDRLKTMEAYKQEKDQRTSSNRPSPLTLNSKFDPSIVPLRRSPRRLPVDSIKEDDEESPAKPSRARQASVSNPPKPIASSSSRVRAVSTSSVAPRALMKFSRTPMPPVASAPIKTHDPMVKGQGRDQFPPRTRAVQRNLESIDLDDIMGESDGESAPSPLPQVKQMGVASPPRHPRQIAVSASTRDLMDFLAEGPPDTAAEDMSGLITDGLPTGEPGKSKGSRRLQKMISKLSLGRGSHDDLLKTKTQQSSSRLQLDTTPSMTNLLSLANRPIPPRPPLPKSPHSTSLDSFEEQSNLGARSRPASLRQKQQDPPEIYRSSPVTSPVPSRKSRDQPPPSWRPPITTSVNGYSKPNVSEEGSNHTMSPGTNAVANSNASNPVDASDIRTPNASSPPPTNPISPKRIQPRKPAPVYSATPTSPHMCYDDIRDMHRLLSKATSADECRLILDMVLAKSGIKIEPTHRDGPPLPSAPPSATAVQITPADIHLEHSLVELLLGGSDYASESEMHKQQTSREHKAQVVSTLPSSHGDNQTASGDPSVTSDAHSHDE